MRGAGIVVGDHRQVARIYFQHCQIGQAVRADQQRFVAAAILQYNGDLLRIFDYVPIGQDITAIVHDHARTQRQYVGGTIHIAVVDIYHGRCGAAHRLVVTDRRFITGTFMFFCEQGIGRT
ncbi:hypothetical protein D3C78_878390 [compost metagenome]